MIVTIHIRRNADGVIREVSEDDWETADYSWTEGNYSCDCNRHLFFERAAGRDPEFDEVPCGDTLYCVRVMNGGVIVYQDPDW